MKDPHTILLTEDNLMEHWQAFLSDCDADILARLTGEAFGGECYSVLRHNGNGCVIGYEFTPNDNYCNAFDEGE